MMFIAEYGTNGYALVRFGDVRDSPIYTIALAGSELAAVELAHQVASRENHRIVRPQPQG